MSKYDFRKMLYPFVVKNVYYITNNNNIAISIVS